MPFSDKFVFDSGREIKVKSAQSDFEAIHAYLQRALKKCAEQTNDIFDPNNVKIYAHGSYVNHTNTYFPSSLEIIVEIKTTAEYDPTTFVESGDKTKKEKFVPGEYRVYDNYFVQANLEFTPRAFREIFFECLASEIGMKVTEKNKTISFAAVERIKHRVEITPCFSFSYKNQIGENFEGILFYDQSIDANIISFPQLHAKYGNQKDAETNGNFKRCVRLYKTLNTILSREYNVAEQLSVTGYFIECLLYNVPNRLFCNNQSRVVEVSDKKFDKDQYTADLHGIFLKTLNYLKNCDMEEFICQNRVWKLFADPTEFWKIQNAKDFLHKIIHLYEVFPESRTFIT